MSEKIVNENSIDLLMQGRQLVHTSYEVTAIQNRIFYFCLLNAQKEKNGNLSCNVKLDDLKKLIPNKNQRTLNNIKKTFQVLKSTSIEFEKNEDGDKIECDYNLIAGSEYNTNKEIFKILFMDRLYKHIIDYTIYAPLNLDILTKFKSFYSQRLYELLRLWSRTGEVRVKNFKVEQLRFILGVENKYPEYKNFKQRVLNQAIKEINSIGNMKVDIEEVKSGRKVEEIKFTILDHERKVYFKNNDLDDFLPKSNMEADIQSDTVEEDIKVDVNFYIPNEKLFTVKTLENFINDFKEYNFKDKVLKRLLQESIIIALEKDDEEKIKIKSYNYFKSTLENKINDFKNNNPNTIRAVSQSQTLNPKVHNFSGSANFLNYAPDELEKTLQESQKDKFKDSREILYNMCIKDGWDKVSPTAFKKAVEYAKENGLEYPIFA